MFETKSANKLLVQALPVDHIRCIGDQWALAKLAFYKIRIQTLGKFEIKYFIASIYANNIIIVYGYIFQ